MAGNMSVTVWFIFMHRGHDSLGTRLPTPRLTRCTPVSSVRVVLVPSRLVEAFPLSRFGEDKPSTSAQGSPTLKNPGGLARTSSRSPGRVLALINWARKPTCAKKVSVPRIVQDIVYFVVIRILTYNISYLLQASTLNVSGLTCNINRLNKALHRDYIFVFSFYHLHLLEAKYKPRSLLTSERVRKVVILLIVQCSFSI